MEKQSNKIYIVKYYRGSYDDYHEVTVFATASESTAKKYQAKFNRMLKKWKDYYSQYEEEKWGARWISEEYSENYFHRWMSLRDITKCYYEEVLLK